MMDRMLKLFGFKFGPNAAAEWVLGNTLDKGQATGTAIGAAGGVVDTDIPTVDRSTLTTMVDMTGAVAGDLTITLILLENDGSTSLGAGLAPVRSVGPTAVGGTRVTFYGEWDVSGLDKVRLRVVNNNAGPQTITRLSWRLS